MEKHRVEIICVGSELLLDRVNTDINILSDIMAKTGLSIKKCTIVPDQEDEVVNAVKTSLEKTDILLVTGGLGPTSDDITKESVAKLLNRKLVYSDSIWKTINERFAKRGLIPSEINKKQAYIIEGSKVIDNYAGTAPGLIVSEGTKKIVLFPGPPLELKPMAEYFASQLQKKFSEGPLVIYRYGISGVSESVVEEKIHPLMKSLNLQYTILAHPQMIEILITAECPAPTLKTIENTMETEFGNDYLGLNPPILPEILGQLLKKKNLTIAIAESCTGGLASKLLTDIPGSSEYFKGSVVAYNNILKKRILKVPKSVIKKYGAVSQETALAMARGIKKAGKADVSISFTGIAGPTGASNKKPVGLVFIGLGLPFNTYDVGRFIFSGNRERIREQAAYKGFDLMIKNLKREHVKK